MTEQVVAAADSRPSLTSSARLVVLRVLRRPAGAIAVAWLTVLAAACLLASAVAPYSATEQDLPASYALPSSDHLLGADQLGRDVLSQILFGGQVSLVAVVEAVLTFVVVGLLFGLIAGYRGGLVDRIVMRGADIVMAIPLVVTLLIVLAIFSRNETAAMITFGLLAASGLVRVVRAATMAIRSDDYVRAAEVAGLFPIQVVGRHILPRIFPVVVIQAALLAGSALLVESGLNYLGLGVQPPTPSWGGMISEASAAIGTHPWLLVPSGGVILLTALAFGIVGDIVRDISADRSATAPSSWRHLLTRVSRGESTAAPSTGSPLLRLRGLTVHSGETKLVDDVNLDVQAGEVVGLVGESGCGKTLTVSSLLRLLPPNLQMTAQQYSVDGADMLSLSERQMVAQRGRVIAFVPQEPVAGLDPVFTVGAQLREFVRLHEAGSRTGVDARVRELLTQVHLPDPDRVLRSYPHELSGGMAQRVAIARALTGRPRVLIADEPTTALDVTVQAGILQLLRELRDQDGLSVILVTHDWGVVAEICDQAIVMYAGQAVEHGPVDALFAHPQHPYTRALLDANPAGAGFRERLRSIPGTVPPPGARADGCRFLDRCSRAEADCAAAEIPMSGGDAHGTRCLHPGPVTMPLMGSPDDTSITLGAGRGIAG